MAGNECKDPGKNLSREAQRDGHNGGKCAIRSRAGKGSSLDCITRNAHESRKYKLAVSPRGETRLPDPPHDVANDRRNVRHFQ